MEIDSFRREANAACTEKKSNVEFAFLLRKQLERRATNFCESTEEHTHRIRSLRVRRAIVKHRTLQKKSQFN